MHDLKANFDIIYEKVNQLGSHFFNSSGNLTRPGPRPKFSDLQVISLSLMAEYLSIDSEKALYTKLVSDYSAAFPNLIDRTNYNRRRRNLFAVLEQIRQRLAAPLTEGEDRYLLDSEPIPICEFRRALRCRTCQEADYALPSYGYCCSQKRHYFGYKLHAVVSLSGVIKHLDLAPAHMHDLAYLTDVAGQMSHCQIIGDKAYLSQPIKQSLKANRQVLLFTPMRANQKNYQAFPVIFRKARKRIETVFSQLTIQFNCKRNWAKSFWGLRTRILSKVTAFTLIQFFNKFVFFREVDQVKIPIY